MNHFIRIAALLTVSTTLSACAIKRQDVIECGLPDGSSFVLRAKYNWHPTSKFIPEAAERTNHTGFIEYYKDPISRQEIGAISDRQYLNTYKDVQVAANYCSVYGLINKVPYSTLTGYKAPSDDHFTSMTYDRSLFYSPALGGTPPLQVREALERLDAGYGGSAIIWRPDRLVVEKLVVNRKSPPFRGIAVYRVESRDGGQTWTNPHITTEAEAFELGKTYDEQCFIARVIRIDDRKIEAHFPPCPISERLPD